MKSRSLPLPALLSSITLLCLGSLLAQDGGVRVESPQIGSSLWRVLGILFGGLRTGLYLLEACLVRLRTSSSFFRGLENWT